MTNINVITIIIVISMIFLITMSIMFHAADKEIIDYIQRKHTKLSKKTKKGYCKPPMLQIFNQNHILQVMFKSCGAEARISREVYVNTMVAIAGLLAPAGAL